MASVLDRAWEWFLTQSGWVYIIYLAFAFSMFFVFVYYFEDRYEREPLRKVLKAFLIGILSIIPAFLLEYGIGFIILSPLLLTCVVAPVVEEACKGYGVFRFRRDPEFDGAVDGFVYGGVIGSGFAFVENILYGLRAYSEYDLTSGLELTAFRGMGLAVGHMLFTAYIGSEIGITKIRGGGFWPKGYIVAVFLHGLWNTVATVAANIDPLIGLGALIAMILAYAMIFRHRLHISRQIDLEEEIKVIKEIPIRKRPFGITILAILVYLEGIFSVIRGFVYTGTVAIELFHSPSWAGGYEIILGIFWILVGIAIMGVGTGLWRLKRSAWTISTIFTAILLFIASAGLPTTWISFGIYLIVLVYLIGARQYFSKIEGELST